MAVLRDDLTQQHAERALLTAMHASDKCLALRRVAVSIGEIFEQAEVELQLTNLSAWAVVAKNLLNRIKGVVAGTDDRLRELRTALGAVVTDAPFDEPYKTFVYRSRTSFPVGRQPARLDLLLIALLCTAAGSESTLAEDLAAGMRQAYKSIADDARNHWREVANKAPLTIAEVDDLLENVKVETVRDFLLQVRIYLATPIAAPKTGLAPEPTAAGHDSGIAAAGPVGASASRRRTRKSGNIHPAPPKAAEERHETTPPTIRAAYREAQLAPLGAKAGVTPLWDRLSFQELAATTRKLFGELTGTDVKRSVMAVLALIAFLVSSNPKAARLLATPSGLPAGGTEIWIDVLRGWICWSQSAYTDCVEGAVSSAAGGRSRSQSFNVIPMPEELARWIRELHAAAGEPDELRGALDHPFGPAGLAMSQVNALLKELGDPVHLSEPTRFASSAGLAMLEVTGSDMAAGHLMHFDLCPASSPFYFSPRSDWLTDVYTRLYERLGLGRPVSLEGAPAR